MELILFLCVMAVFMLTVVVASTGSVRHMVDRGCLWWLLDSRIINWICGTDDGFGDGSGLIVFRYFRWRR